MPLSLIFGSISASGIALICLSLWLFREGRGHIRRAAVAQRFSGKIREAGSMPVVADPVALVREQVAQGWRALFRSGQAEGTSPPSRRIALTVFLIVTSLVTLLLHKLTGGGLMVGIAAGIILSLLIWLIQMRWLRKRRIAAIDDSLPEAMDLIVRSLRVGLPVGTAIQAAGRELSGAVAREFTETSDRISYGQDVVAALRDMAERCENQSLRFFAAAVSIQATTGGNLAEVLERLAAIARGRLQMRRKIRAITAEAKWSGRFLSFFPIFAVLMLLSINPDYFAAISDQAFFLPMLAVVTVLLLLNILFMRWLVRIE